MIYVLIGFFFSCLLGFMVKQKMNSSFKIKGRYYDIKLIKAAHIAKLWPTDCDMRLEKKTTFITQEKICTAHQQDTRLEKKIL
jgi:hypothetical protein